MTFTFMPFTRMPSATVICPGSKVTSDNGPSYVSKAFAKASCVLGLQHKDVVHRAARLTNLLRHNI